MPVSYKSSGVTSAFTLQCVDVSVIENTGLNDFVSSSSTVYSVDIENTHASSTIVYVKIYDHKSPTYGTTDPDIMFTVAAVTRQVWTIAQGVSMSNGVSLMTSKADGPDATAAPDEEVNVSFVMT